MWNHIRLIVLAIFIGTSATTGVACKKNEDKAQAEGMKARKEVDEKSAEAARAAKEAEDRAAAALKEAGDKTMKASAEARAMYKKGLDDAERKIAYLKEKAAKAKGAMQKNAVAAATEVDKRYEAAKAGVAKLETEAAAGWETAKIQVETDIDALNKSIDGFEATLKK